MVTKGCSYGKVTRQIVIDLKDSINEHFGRVDKSFNEIKEENKQLYNHLSSRLPIWVSILFTILGSAVVGFIVHSFT